LVLQRKLGSKQAHRTLCDILARVHGLAALAAAWVKAIESVISVALWAKWLWKTTFFTVKEQLRKERPILPLKVIVTHAVLSYGRAN